MGTPETTYVTFSNAPLTASKTTIALAGNTDDQTTLAELLTLMYKTWRTDAFQEGIRAEQPRVIFPDVANYFPVAD